MIPATVVFLYLAAVLSIGIVARGSASSPRSDAEEFFLAGRSLGPAVFLLSLFGANMTAFSILGASGHAFANGIVTFGLMASSSALIIPLTLFVIGTRLWALGGTTLAAVSGGHVPYGCGGGIVSLVVMGYVFLGGMRGTPWVNTFQTLLFLAFGTASVAVIAAGMGGYTFIPLSSIAFPHIGIFASSHRGPLPPAARSHVRAFDAASMAHRHHRRHRIRVRLL